MLSSGKGTAEPVGKNRFTKAVFVPVSLLHSVTLQACRWMLLLETHYHKASLDLWGCKLGENIYDMIITEYLMSWA